MPDGGVHLQPAIMSPEADAALNADDEVEGASNTVVLFRPELVGKFCMVTVTTPAALVSIADTYLVWLDSAALTSQPQELAAGKEEVDW